VSSPFNFMIPQVLVFVFLAATSVVSIWRDLGNSLFSLATAWSITNTFILGAFVVVALREVWHNKHPRVAPAAPVVELDDEQRTRVIVPPALQHKLGVQPAPVEDDQPAQLTSARTTSQHDYPNDLRPELDSLVEAEKEGATS
jgi:cellulose synthase (UDP-forming)